MHVHYPAASNAAALKTALKAMVTKGSVLQVPPHISPISPLYLPYISALRVPASSRLS